MTVTDISKDLEQRTLQVDSEFDAPVDVVWQLWADPRRLERWWGPPTYPATFVDHDLRPGGSASYFMTGPAGNTSKGWWRFIEVDAPHRIVFEDGFADDDGVPNDDMPVTVMRVDVAARPGGGSTMRICSTYPSTEAMEQLIAMGMEEGMSEALGQIEAILAEFA